MSALDRQNQSVFAATKMILNILFTQMNMINGKDVNKKEIKEGSEIKITQNNNNVNEFQDYLEDTLGKV